MGETVPVNERRITLLLDQNQADVFDALRFFGETDLLADAIEQALATAAADRQVATLVRLRRAERRERSGLRVVS